MVNIFTIAIVVVVLTACVSENNQFVVETEIGPLEASEFEIPSNYKAKYRDLTDQEFDWLSQNSTVAKEIISTYINVDGKIVVSASNMDIAYKKWVIDTNKDKIGIGVLTTAFGVALGMSVAERNLVQWKVVTDIYGTDMALEFAGREMRIFPISSVAKRIERGEVDFFAQLYHFFNAVEPGKFK